jgi:isoquinoline 1-oxidoreductase subunit beta
VNAKTHVSMSAGDVPRAATADAAGYSRRDFLRVSAAAGGGMLIGLALTSPSRSATPAAKEPVAARFSPNAFVRIERSGQVAFVVPRVEMGQGIYTAISMLLAEELEVDLAQVRVEHAPADDLLYADPLLKEQITGGSLAIRGAWLPLRQAGAVARTMLVAAAAEAWKADAATCVAEKGTVRHVPTGRTLSYGELAAAAATQPMPANVPLKAPKDFKLIGTAARRVEGVDKVRGRATFGIDVRLPDMRVASVAACPVAGGRLESVDDSKARAIKGVRQIVKIDDAVAVVADNMWAAMRGLAALSITWAEGENTSFTLAALAGQMKAASARDGAIAENIGDARAASANASKRIDAVYELPFLAHAAMEPLNCTVHITPESCDVWTGSQVPARAQAAAARITGLPKEQVRIHNQYLGGGFGRRLEVDYVEQAVRFGKQVQGPVKFVWSREEDLQHDYMRPPFYNTVSAALDAKGMPLAWSHRIVGPSIMTRWFPGFVKDGVDGDAVEGAVELVYAIANVHVDYVRHEVPFTTGNWRGVGPTHNVFVVESFIDELAAGSGTDPVAYRLALLEKVPRAKAVLEMAAEKSGWRTRLRNDAGNGVRVGRGVSVLRAFGSFGAQVAEVSVAANGEVSVTRIVCVIDCGQIINPDTVHAQMEGGIIYALSAVLWGKITFDQGRVVQSNFHDYRVLRMNEAPPVEVHLIESSQSPGGTGEFGTAGLFPAVTNAVFAATGKRVRSLPIDPRELKA